MNTTTSAQLRRDTKRQRAAALLLLVGAAAATLLTWAQRPGAARLAVATMARPAVAAAAAVPAIAATRADRTAPPDAPTAQPQDHITRHGELLVIDTHTMPLAEVVRQLALLTHSTLEGAELLHRAHAGTRLQWQGSNAAVAWQQVLGDEHNYIARCLAQRCQVRVLGPAGTRRADITPMPHASDARATVPQTDPPGLFPADS